MLGGLWGQRRRRRAWRRETERSIPHSAVTLNFFRERGLSQKLVLILSIAEVGSSYILILVHGPSLSLKNVGELELYEGTSANFVSSFPF